MRAASRLVSTLGSYTACRKLFKSLAFASGSPGATLFSFPARIHFSSVNK